jgi:hypothetical protein
MLPSGRSGSGFSGGQDSECEPCLRGDLANCLNPISDYNKLALGADVAVSTLSLNKKEDVSLNISEAFPGTFIIRLLCLGTR